MLTDRFLMGRGRRFLSDEDFAVIEDAIERVVDLSARTIMVHRGEPVAATSSVRRR